MLQITDPGIPNGITQNLGGLVQALIERKDKERQFQLEQQRIQAIGGYRQGMLAEQIRNHDLVNDYHTGMVDASQQRADTGAGNAEERVRHNQATEAQAGANLAEKTTNDQVTQGAKQTSQNDAMERSIADKATRIHQAWLNSPAGMTAVMSDPTGQAEHAHYQMTEDLVRKNMKPAQPQSAQPQPPPPAPQPTGATPGGVNPPPHTGTAPPAVSAQGQAPSAPAGMNTTQIQLLNKAKSWMGLPSLSEGDRLKVQQAVNAKDFNALGVMDRRMSQQAMPPIAR